MKQLSLVVGTVLSLAIPILAQTVGGPIELRNPHRRNEIGVQSTETPIVAVPGVPASIASTENSNSSSASSPSVALFADGRYLFVLRGESLFQFDKKTLKLLHSTQLPHSATSSLGGAQEKLRSQISPPLRPGPLSSPAL